MADYGRLDHINLTNKVLNSITLVAELDYLIQIGCNASVNFISQQ